MSPLFVDKLEPQFKKPGHPYSWLCLAIMFSLVAYIDRKNFIEGINHFYQLRWQQTHQINGILNTVLVEEVHMGTDITCDFTYHVNETIYKAHENFSLSGTKVYNTGDSVQVTYNSIYPQISTVAPKSIDTLMTIITSTLLAIIVSGIAFIVLLVQRYSKQRLQHCIAKIGAGN